MRYVIVERTRGQIGAAVILQGKKEENVLYTPIYALHI